MTRSQPRILCVATHHKTGTSWMQSVFLTLARELKIPIRRIPVLRQWKDLPEQGRVMVVNWRSNFAPGLLAKDDARFFHIIRDPRDVLLSGTRYHETTARATYDDLMIATGISRTKISDGLDILAKRNLIVRGPEGRSTFGLTNYGEEHRWAGLPAKPLYDPHWSIPMFEDFHLRKPAELDAVKLYLAFAARRDTGQNVTRMTYNHISDYAGIKLGRIKRALGILNINGLITVESYERMDGLPGASHGYRLAHLYPTLHAGTTGRATRGPADDLQNYD